MPASTVTIKLAFEGELRRVRVPAAAGFADLHAAIVQRLAVPAELSAALKLTWTDEEGDVITVATDADWAEAMASAGAAALKLTATVAPAPAAGPAVPSPPSITVTPDAATAAPTDAAGPKHTLLAMLVDRSGSMQSLGPEVIGGVHSYLDQVAGDDSKDGSRTDVLFATFDNEYAVVHSGAPLPEVRAKVTASDMTPRGMTALWDGIGYVLRDTEAKIATMPSRPGKVIVFILTDGAENSSREWGAGSVRKRIAELEKKGFEFFFAAAGQDALQTGQSIGLSADDCITWEAGSRASATATFASCAQQHNMAKRGMSKAFTPQQRSRSSPMKPAGSGSPPSASRSLFGSLFGSPPPQARSMQQPMTPRALGRSSLRHSGAGGC